MKWTFSRWLLLGKEGDAAMELLNARIAPLMKHPKWKYARLQRFADGTLQVYLDCLPVPDLLLLEGLPISNLNISSTGAADLAPAFQSWSRLAGFRLGKSSHRSRILARL